MNETIMPIASCRTKYPSVSRHHLFPIILLVTCLVLLSSCAAALPPSIHTNCNGNTSGNANGNIMTPPSSIQKVMVTGANGYLASHIVQTLLAKGYTVHACVRDATNPASIRHLRALPGATPANLRFFSTGDMADSSLRGRFVEPISDCDAVIHAATPLSPKLSGREFDGFRDVLNPGMEGTREVLDAILDECRRRPSRPVRCLVLTSSMSAAAPVPEPPVKDESHWSDDERQLANKNFYGCLKTRQERLCHEWTASRRDDGGIPPDFRFTAICPTMIIGPPVVCRGDGDAKYAPSGTMGSFYKWLTGGRPTAPNDSMSFVDVRDCAAMHVVPLERDDVRGRYFSLVESWYWNDILTTLKELHPKIPEFQLYAGEDRVTPTKFDLGRMHSLGVEVKGVKEILRGAIEFFKEEGLLDD
ncbi:hypothetical protein ACHAXS_013588 [Conticribra weissflogii]